MTKSQPIDHNKKQPDPKIKSAIKRLREAQIAEEIKSDLYYCERYKQWIEKPLK